MIVDGAWPDGTLEIIEEYEKHSSLWASQPTKACTRR
jgi:hypothetical protein